MTPKSTPRQPEKAKGRAEKNYSGVGSYGEVSTSRTGELGRAPPDLF